MGRGTLIFRVSTRNHLLSESSQSASFVSILNGCLGKCSWRTLSGNEHDRIAPGPALMAMGAQDVRRLCDGVGGTP